MCSEILFLDRSLLVQWNFQKPCLILLSFTRAWSFCHIRSIKWKMMIPIDYGTYGQNWLECRKTLKTNYRLGFILACGFETRSHTVFRVETLRWRPSFSSPGVNIQNWMIHASKLNPFLSFLIMIKFLKSLDVSGAHCIKQVYKVPSL